MALVNSILIHNSCYKENEWFRAMALDREPKVQTLIILFNLTVNYIISLSLLCPRVVASGEKVL